MGKGFRSQNLGLTLSEQCERRSGVQSQSWDWSVGGKSGLKCVMITEIHARAALYVWNLGTEGKEDHRE